MKCSRPFAMTQLPTGDGRADEWQSTVSHKRCLAATEAPLVSTTGSEGAREEVTMGFAFRFGLFRKSPKLEKHAITSGLPDGSIELDVPFTATTLRQFRRPDDEADTTEARPTPPNTAKATKRAKTKEKSEKRGWLRGLAQKLHRSEGGKEREQEDEGEKEKEKKEKENAMVERMRVVVSFVLVPE